MMQGLPRAKDTTRAHDAFSLMVLGGIERMTQALRRGDPFTEQGLNDMLAIQRRLKAFSDALDARMPVTEDD